VPVFIFSLVESCIACIVCVVCGCGFSHVFILVLCIACSAVVTDPSCGIRTYVSEH